MFMAPLAHRTSPAVNAAMPEIDSSRLTRFLGFRLTRAKVHVHRHIQKQLAGWSLSATEFSVLVLVEANPAVYLRQLASALDLSPPNLVPVIDRLVQRGLLEKQVSAEDRRMQVLGLTSAGRCLLADAEAEVVAFEQALEQALTVTERRHVDSALKKLARISG